MTLMWDMSIGTDRYFKYPTLTDIDTTEPAQSPAGECGSTRYKSTLTTQVGEILVSIAENIGIVIDLRVAAVALMYSFDL